jgi:deazaflavin-dependent oxidoreductase (nitroreductase family)
VDLGFRGLNALHRTTIRLSGGRLGRRAFGMAVVELHTIGRRSGLERSTILTAPVVQGERVVLVASKGGDDRDPDWYRNLAATPEVELTMDGARSAMRARTATAEEAASLWPLIVAAYGPYAGYRRRSSREIPVVLLEPR